MSQTFKGLPASTLHGVKFSDFTASISSYFIAMTPNGLHLARVDGIHFPSTWSCLPPLFPSSLCNEPVAQENECIVCAEDPNSDMCPSFIVTIWAPERESAHKQTTFFGCTLSISLLKALFSNTVFRLKYPEFIPTVTTDILRHEPRTNLIYLSNFRIG